MNYTKIVTSDKTWQHIITAELKTEGKKPICKIACRFKIYQLKILSQNHTNDLLVAYIISGFEREGQCLLFIRVDLTCDMIVDFSLKRHIAFDKQLAHFLSLAFLKRLQKRGTYNVSIDVFNKFSSKTFNY